MSADTTLMPIPGPIDPVPVPRPTSPRADGRVELFEMETGAPLGIDPEAYGEGHAGMLAPGDCLFCFTDGVTEARNRQGELFGEMAYLLGEPRSATVVAETDITVLALPPQLLEELMRYSAPFSRRIIGSLCQRLKVMNLQKAA